jgi:hypothetical protein
MLYKKIDIGEITFYNISEDCAKAFIDFRIEIKSPMTQRAFNMALKEAVRCESLGITAEEAIDKTVYWGWKAVDYAYIAKKLSEQLSATLHATAMGFAKSYDKKSTRDMTLAEQLNDRSWADKH